MGSVPNGFAVELMRWIDKPIRGYALSNAAENTNSGGFLLLLIEKR